MKHLFSFLFLFIAATTISLAQGVFSFEELEHNFGDIKEGELAEHVFAFENTGDAPIVIENVRASCGCTTPQWPKEPIMPGESAEIKAVFNSKGRPGNVYKTITITSNASETTKTLKLRGQVIKSDSTPE
ncbi:DUF1573 domain-containing protein [Chondrinema litorale]|uniref:DUF1573 domain-containing protein n=1 Tax=Chondrinema litorale TaxID=2994555 RepID=UPI002543EC34|nr:DUF1573 domain-containing protein [Chondrinema litorale]UZR93804.1 DUF1573 domain-containing protein [Chondrinema litorale]